ncbi:PREDICTED: ninjurin-2-like isoform X1 [Branchiostoma belcheri]|uniref:Ninjurin-2-like isoform X1 n=1 Tax=Branchiostoma belcheri TaxID=7741 RepID=A0A6P4Z9I6_BRABE|nr:PREDICTED: ninjurin-2-like isoform X1 [Branchiostoma belcheri]XP_019630600.1 PREDICTED: ninjurin-2-like isoform X1 [Branchiostoma belcheri]
MANDHNDRVEMAPLTGTTNPAEGGEDSPPGRGEDSSETDSENGNPTDKKWLLPSGALLGRVISNVNTYATLKTVVQGLMDTALFTSNASQMANLLKSRETDPFTNLEVARVTLLSFSMVFQVVIFSLLVVQGATNIEKLEKDEEKRKKQEEMLKATNIAAIVFSMLVVLINIFVTKLE